MNESPRGSTTSRPRLGAAGRFIQFRSELAIVTVLAMGVGAGALARRALSLSAGPSAVIASPRDTAAPRPAHSTRPAPSSPPAPAFPQVADTQ